MVERSKRIIAGLLIVAAVVYLIVTSTGDSAAFFLTVDELYAMGDRAEGRRITVAGGVVGETIVVEADPPRVRFRIVQVPADPEALRRAGGLAAALAAAVADPSARQLTVVYEGARPELLQGGVEAIARGYLEGDALRAEEVLLKCPSRYGEELPAQVEDAR